MFKSCLPAPMVLLAGLAVCTSVSTSACTSPVSERLNSDSEPAHSQRQPSAVTRPAPASKASPDAFQAAIERAASASSIGQSAQSRDDWRLVANRWQQAIAMLRAIPVSSPERAEAQQKIIQYQRNLAYAQRQANLPTAPINPNGVVVLPIVRPQISRPVPPVPMAAAMPQSSPQPEAPPSAVSRRFSAPIVRRAGSTPVIRVIFNDEQPFEMIVDTGASGTLITRQMASQLGVVAVAQANVDTASQRGVTFPLGYVQSISVGGAVANHVLVAVAGPELDVGLLGHDFFGNYDVIIREREVEFQER